MFSPKPAPAPQAQSLVNRIGQYIPGTKWGTEAVQYWSAKQAQTGNPLYAVPRTFASLWTPDTALTTIFALGATGAIIRGERIVASLTLPASGVMGGAAILNNARLFKHGINATLGATTGYISAVTTGGQHPWRSAFFGGASGFALGFKTPLGIKNAMSRGAVIGGGTNFIDQFTDYLFNSTPINPAKIAISTFSGGLIAGQTYGMPISSATVVGFGPTVFSNAAGELIFEHSNSPR